MKLRFNIYLFFFKFNFQINKYLYKRNQKQCSHINEHLELFKKNERLTLCFY